jgi:GNAT superfamily N-acetyltransferase
VAVARYRADVPDLVIRPYEDADEGPVLDLLAASLGKSVDDRYRRFFQWKHFENPVGRSFMWVAEVESTLAGFRAFLRWRFVDRGGEPVEAVRAVDTATRPELRGMGVFRDLTLHGLDEVKSRGIAFVFNTPNDQSRPGYVKMGWEVIGRIPVQVRPRTPLSVWKMVGSRTAAGLWSLPTEVGADPCETLTDDVVAGLVGQSGGRPPAGRQLTTDRSGAFLRWRYGGFGPVGSRVVGDAALAILRFRGRGGAVECTVGEVLGTDRSDASRAVRSAMRRADATYALAGVGGVCGGRLPGFIATDRLGPLMTWRSVTRASAPELSLALGDVELF